MLRKTRPITVRMKPAIQKRIPPARSARSSRNKAILMHQIAVVCAFSFLCGAGGCICCG